MYAMYTWVLLGRRSYGKPPPESYAKVTSVTVLEGMPFLRTLPRVRHTFAST